ncbi:MAG: DinB family protein [Dehalococcoidia bacterium]|nr:DinB family protein [Dehalococcoidia bacterium]
MASERDIQDLLSKLDEERTALLAALEGMSEAAAEVRPPDAVHGEAGWSVKEQLAHLAEMEATYRAWVQRAVVEREPDLAAGTFRDPVAYPLEGAERVPVGAHLDELAEQRTRTLAVLDSLTLEEFERRARSEFGLLTALQLLRSLYRHDRMHRAQILGRASEYQPAWGPGGEPDQRRRAE